MHRIYYKYAQHANVDGDAQHDCTKHQLHSNQCDHFWMIISNTFIACKNIYYIWKYVFAIEDNIEEWSFFLRLCACALCTIF